MEQAPSAGRFGRSGRFGSVKVSREPAGADR